MFLVFFGVCLLILQTIIGAPVEENNALLKKRELHGLVLPLTDIISNVENSLIQEAYSAGSAQEFGKLRNGRQADLDNSPKSPKAQLSILTVKLNSQKSNDSNKNSNEFVNPSNLQTEKEIKILKDSIKEKNDKFDSSEEIREEQDSKKNVKDKKSGSTELIDPTDISSNTSQVKENIKNEKEKKIVNTVAEVQVHPVILASRP